MIFVVFQFALHGRVAQVEFPGRKAITQIS